MHVGVDATCWHNTRGYGRHARALLSALVGADTANRYTLVMDREANGLTLPRGADVKIVPTTKAASVAASANGNRSVSDMWRMSRALSDARFDLLLFPTVYTYVPVFTRAKKIVIVHDVIAEKYPQLTLPRRSARLFWKTKVALGRWQADALVTVSDYSRRGIVEQFKMNADRVFVVGEAGDPVFRVLPTPRFTPHLESLGITAESRTVVYVGGFSPHKNLETLVTSFAKLASQGAFSDVRLVMVGEYEKEVFHSYFGTIKKMVEALGITDRVIFTGYLPDSELVTLLNLATVFVLPSLIEGFGLPAVEAAACGCPVIATKESPLPSLLGDGGVYIDPANRDELEAAMTRVLGSQKLRRKLSEAGCEAASKLTWEAAARQMTTLIQTFDR